MCISAIQLCLLKNYRTVVIRNNDTLFTLGDAEKFLGKDSEIFNPKLQKLMFLMLWLASPSIREYLPTPNDTIQTKAPPQM